MVKPNLWLDRRPSRERAAGTQLATMGSGRQAGGWIHGRIEEVLEDGLVRVGLPADEPVSEVVAPSDGTVTAVGAVCVCLLDGTGRVVQVAGPSVVPDGAPVVATGEAGRAALEGGLARQELAEAERQLRAAQERLGVEIAAAAAAATASGEAAAAALKRALGRVTVAASAPQDPVDGDLWVVSGPDGQVTGIQVWESGQWVDYLLVAGRILVPGSVGNAVIADGAVSAPKITASSELWAKIATFASVTTEMLIAGNATIAGTAVVGEIVGNIVRGAQIIGSQIVGGDILMASDDASGSVHIYRDAGRGVVDITDSDGSVTRLHPGGVRRLSAAGVDLGSVSWRGLIQPPVGRVVLSPAGTLWQQAQWVPVNVGAGQAVVVGGVAASGGGLRVPETGLYLVSATGNFSRVASGIRGIAIRINGVMQEPQALTDALSDTETRVTLSEIFRVAKGQPVSLSVYQNSGAAVNMPRLSVSVAFLSPTN